MTENKFSNISGAHSPGTVQKTLIFNKSKEKLTGQQGKTNTTVKVDRKSAGLQGYQYNNPTHYAQKLSGDIKDKNKINFYGSTSSKNLQK